MVIIYLLLGGCIYVCSCTLFAFSSSLDVPRCSFSPFEVTFSASELRCAPTYDLLGRLLGEPYVSGAVVLRRLRVGVLAPLTATLLDSAGGALVLDLGVRVRLAELAPVVICNMVAGLAGMSYCTGVIPRRSSILRNWISASRHS